MVFIVSPILKKRITSLATINLTERRQVHHFQKMQKKQEQYKTQDNLCEEARKRHKYVLSKTGTKAKKPLDGNKPNQNNNTFRQNEWYHGFINRHRETNAKNGRRPNF